MADVLTMKYCLDHFAVNFILPNKEVISNVVVDLGMGKYENALAPWKLEGLPTLAAYLTRSK